MEQVKEKQVLNLNDIKTGDVFSEESHYVFLGKQNNSLNTFKHLESGEIVTLDDSYVSNLLVTADQFFETVEVGVEDKLWTEKQIKDAIAKGELEADTKVREGDIKLKGIRSIWSDIHTTRVLSVNFNKKGKELSKKAFNQAKEKQIKDALAEISSGKVTLEDAFKFIQENPITQLQKGDERTLRGYKIQFSSQNGFFDVIDMDIEDDGKGSNIRQVNINTINWLVVDGVKYIVK